jgi:hypothetical protein
MERNDLNSLSGVILDYGITVHKIMGAGLLESVYEHCLMKEFEISKEFKVDILVENEIILELKSSEIMHPVYEAQIISYLKLVDKRLGFLINFNVPILKNGFKRYVNNISLSVSAP